MDFPNLCGSKSNFPKSLQKNRFGKISRKVEENPGGAWKLWGSRKENSLPNSNEPVANNAHGIVTHEEIQATM